MPKAIDLEALDTLLTLRCNRTPGTIIKDIQKLGARISLHTIWQPKAARKRAISGVITTKTERLEKGERSKNTKGYLNGP